MAFTLRQAAVFAKRQDLSFSASDRTNEECGLLRKSKAIPAQAALRKNVRNKLDGLNQITPPFAPSG